MSSEYGLLPNYCVIQQFGGFGQAYYGKALPGGIVEEYAMLFLGPDGMAAHQARALDPNNQANDLRALPHHSSSYLHLLDIESFVVTEGMSHELMQLCERSSREDSRRHEVGSLGSGLPCIVLIQPLIQLC